MVSHASSGGTIHTAVDMVAYDGGVCGLADVFFFVGVFFFFGVDFLLFVFSADVFLDCCDRVLVVLVLLSGEDSKLSLAEENNVDDDV